MSDEVKKRKIRGCLTVGELREMLEGYDDDMPIITQLWDRETGQYVQTQFVGDVVTTEARLGFDGDLADGRGDKRVFALVDALHFS